MQLENSPKVYTQHIKLPNTAVTKNKETMSNILKFCKEGRKFHLSSSQKSIRDGYHDMLASYSGCAV